ncbi:MAG: hypothetical protein E7Y34_01545 [Mycoplasma sp.]|nr:hypothetical protein [Mycoplasma sp.]
MHNPLSLKNKWHFKLGNWFILIGSIVNVVLISLLIVFWKNISTEFGMDSSKDKSTEVVGKVFLMYILLLSIVLLVPHIFLLIFFICMIRSNPINRKYLSYYLFFAFFTPFTAIGASFVVYAIDDFSFKTDEQILEELEANKTKKEDLLLQEAQVYEPNFGTNNNYYPQNINYLKGLTQKQKIMLWIGQNLTIVSAIFYCATIVGMIFGIPMIIGCSKRKKGEKPITTLHVFLAFLFFNPIGAILTIFANRSSDYSAYEHVLFG